MYRAPDSDARQNCQLINPHSGPPHPPQPPHSGPPHPPGPPHPHVAKKKVFCPHPPRPSLSSYNKGIRSFPPLHFPCPPLQQTRLSAYTRWTGWVDGWVE